MPTYLDTSAVLRILEQRGDLSLVEAALNSQPITSSLAELECWASVHKKWLDGEIHAVRRDELLHNASGLFTGVRMLTLDSDVFAEAFTVTQVHPLRTLDGLHLATAALARRRLEPRGHHVRFCTADRRQAQAAERHMGADQVDLVPPWR